MQPAAVPRPQPPTVTQPRRAGGPAAGGAGDVETSGCITHYCTELLEFLACRATRACYGASLGAVAVAGGLCAFVCICVHLCGFRWRERLSVRQSGVREQQRCSGPGFDGRLRHRKERTSAHGAGRLSNRRGSRCWLAGGRWAARRRVGVVRACSRAGVGRWVLRSHCFTHVARPATARS